MREDSFSQSELARALLARVKGSTLFPIETLTKVSFRFVVVVVNVVFLLFSFFFRSRDCSDCFSTLSSIRGRSI